MQYFADTDGRSAPFRTETDAEWINGGGNALHVGV